MATFPRITLLAVAAAVAVALSGCLAPPLDPVPAPAPTAEPVFASEEEALAAATEAYAAYLAVSDQIAIDGGEQIDRLASLVSGSYLLEQEKSYANFASSGLHTTGYTTFEPPTLQSTNHGAGVTEIALYVCVDVSVVRLVDDLGMDKTPLDRVSKYPLVVQFITTSTSGRSLVISSSEAWTGANFCSGE